MQRKLASIFILFSFCCLLFSESQVAQNTVGEASQMRTSPANSEPSLRFPISSHSHETIEDLTIVRPMDAPMPDNIRSEVYFDVNSGLYLFRTFVGDIEISTPFVMSETEFMRFSAQQERARFWRERDTGERASNEDRFSLTDMRFTIGAADRVFGPGGVQVRTQGSTELIFGITHRRIDNPSIAERQRRSTTPDFSQNIQLNVNARVGTRVNFNMNYNTQAAFAFDQRAIRLAYQGEEDDIVQLLEAGNVSMRTSNSLISGGTSLFGVRSDLQFGRLTVSAVASQQQTQARRVSTRGGVQTTAFDIRADEFDQNRHFFLAHYFRDNFEDNLRNLPVISSGIQITDVEVWVTNRRGNFDESRNIVALMDLGEHENIYNSKWLPFRTELPDNRSNTMYNTILNIPDIRNVQNVNRELSALEMNGGVDFEVVGNARRLNRNEFSFNAALGTITLRSALGADEVLGVAFRYSRGGQNFQVGEFSTDPDNRAPDVLFVKMLKSTVEDPSLPMWDLMMRNVYRITPMQLNQQDFRLNIVFRNDSIGTDLQFLTEGDIRNQNLLQVMKLDQLDLRQRRQPDGIFDFIEGITVNSSMGTIMFPVLEPFGTHLRTMINNDAIAERYVFEQMYRMPLDEARQYSEFNRFRLVGEFRGQGAQNQISLNAMNVPRGSVTVTAGGRTLVENTDFTVDYVMGMVTILDQALLESNTAIDVRLESQNMFNMQRQSLFGTHVEYQFSRNFMLGATAMRMNETPITTKTRFDNEPISNTIWGMNTAWRGQSQLLTSAVNALPFVNATAPSTFSVNAEFAQLIPGQSNAIHGFAYVDDFEATVQNISLHHNPTHYWNLASVPVTRPESALTDDVRSGFNRALISWYSVDPTLNQNNRNTPANLRNNPDLQSQHITRNVLFSEIFPNRVLDTQTSSVLRVMNVSFFPNIRGPYNLDYSAINEDGTLSNPADRWGGLMRRIDPFTSNFEERNIEYIEFWLMDPFVSGPNGIENPNHQGGYLFFNLGDVSEDILRDGRMFFENGLDPNGIVENNDVTAWGMVPRIQSSVRAFDNNPEARRHQDVGLNGLSTVQERTFGAYATFLNNLYARLPRTIWEQFYNDPAADNFHFYRGQKWDNWNNGEGADILTRYMFINGTEGNSAVVEGSEFGTSITNLPDTEDINNDNTMNENERYLEYRIAIRPDQMNLNNPWINEIAERTVSLPNGQTETVRWYQFRIPIHEGEARGNGRPSFRSIRFMRMYMTGFEEKMTLRFATLDLVRGEWRTFARNEQLTQPDVPPISDGRLVVSAVNIDEHSTRQPVNYVMPPGVTRQTTPGQMQIIPQNEQAMVLRVTDLAPGDARAVFRRVSLDMRMHKRLQMFVHAHEMVGTTLNNDDLTVFIRLGSDMTMNFYEYEIPLELTPHGRYMNNLSADRLAVWPHANMFDFPLQALVNAKNQRNIERQNPNSGITNMTVFETFDPEKQRNRISVRGNPVLSEVRYIMIGVRNRTNNEIRSGEVWVNELRMAEFNNEGGWAFQGNAAMALSDIASFNVAGRRETTGFGSIESMASERRMDDFHQINFSTSTDLGRFLPEQARIQVPTHFAVSNEVSAPKFNPLDSDVLLRDALDALATEEQRDSLRDVSNTVRTTRSFNITNARVNIRSEQPRFFDPANFSFTYAFTESNDHTPEIERNLMRRQRVAMDYSHSFNSQPFQPFNNVEALSNPWLQIIREANVFYMPASISFNTDMNRQFSQTVLRSFDTQFGGDDIEIPFSQDFMWSRRFALTHNLTRAISLTFNSQTNAMIEEGMRLPELNEDYYDEWRRQVWSSIRELGTPFRYEQNFTASWNLPINKIPIFNWVTASVSYNSMYNWQRIELDFEDMEMGNIAGTTGVWNFTGQFNLEQLYNRSTFLRGVDTRMRVRGQNRPPFQSRTYTQTVSLVAGESRTINHRLNSNRVTITAETADGRPVRISQSGATNTAIDIRTNADVENVTLTIVSQDPNFRTPAEQALDFTARALMMVRRARFTYRETSSMTVPGFKPEPSFMGQARDASGIFSPGIDFAFGFFDEQTTLLRMRERGWLIGEDPRFVNPAIFAHATDLDIQASLEPIMGFRIELNARQSTQANRTVLFTASDSPDNWNTNFTGNFNITTITLRTAFRSTGNALNNFQSETYDTFLANRHVILNRLNQKFDGSRYPNAEWITNGGALFDPSLGTFHENSPEVLIPAFIAAYTGRDVNRINMSPIIQLSNILPNWRVTYDGLIRIPWIRERFRSVSLSHGYTSRYTIGAYTSPATWVAMDGSSDFGFVRNNITENPTPASRFDIPTVTLTEQFSPLIGINVTMRNSITANLRFNTGRNLALNLSSTQLAERNEDEIVVGMGYTINNFNVILGLPGGTQTRVSNDLRINLDVSYRNNQMLLRKLDEDITQATSGNQSFGVRLMADYVFSSRLNLQAFFDHQSTTPLISTSFPVSNTNFGVGMRFMLTR